MKKALITAFCLAIASATASHASTVNWARNATATASGEYFPTDRAFDGDTSTFWNAGGGATDKNPQFIELDLGEKRVIGSIQGVIRISPGGETIHNIYLDDVLSFSWDQTTSDFDILTHNFKDFVEARFVRIETTLSGSWVAWGELRVFNEPAPVPVPASALMLISALSGFGLMKRRKHKAA